MITFFCPVCWSENASNKERCPCCGSDIREHEKKGFEDKVINALNHPDRETVLRAAWILGRLKSSRAVKPLIRLFEQTADPYTKAAILASLDQTGKPEALAFITGSLDSETVIVRKTAEILMERNS